MSKIHSNPPVHSHPEVSTRERRGANGDGLPRASRVGITSSGAATMISHDVRSSNRIHLNTRWRRTRRVAIILMAGSLAGVALAPHRVAAQQERQGEVHANYSRQTQSKSDAWGAGTQLQLVWGAKKAPVVLGTS